MSSKCPDIFAVLGQGFSYWVNQISFYHPSVQKVCEKDYSNINNFVNPSVSSQNFKIMTEQHADVVILFCWLQIDQPCVQDFFLHLIKRQAMMGMSLGMLSKQQKPI